ncbi:MAG: response regulator transcription factor [Anaerolineae bacterium]
MPDRILIIDNNESSANGLRQKLAKKKYIVTIARNAKTAFKRVQTDLPDLIIVDTTSSRLNGRKICRKLSQKVEAPVIAFISNKDKPVSEAAENLVKPFTWRKLLSRVRKTLQELGPKVLQVGEVSLDPKTRQVTRGKVTHKLTPKQCKLLKVFMSNRGQVLSRKILMKDVWDTDYLGDTRTLDVHVRWVREKIEKNPSAPEYLRTVRGTGYRFDAPS